MMTDEEIALMKLAANATLAYGSRECGPMANDVLRLLAEVERLRAENAALREIVQAVAATRQRYADDCLWCGEQGDETLRHTIDCPVSKARTLLADGKASK